MKEKKCAALFVSHLGTSKSLAVMMNSRAVSNGGTSVKFEKIVGLVKISSIRVWKLKGRKNFALPSC
jgi:hypothetical protein